MFRSSWKNGKKFLKNCEAGVVQQIDIVPTLCWILNISTPFSNIGSIITELLPLSPDEEAQAVHANAKQILRYMTEYNKRYHTFPEHELATLRQSLASFKHDNTTTGQLLRAMADAREMCRGVWAQFDVAHMTAGGAMFTCTCLLLLGTIRKYESIALAAVLGSSAAVFSLLSSVAWRSFALLCAAAVPIAITIRYRDICAAMTSFPVLAAALISPTLMTSNSFVVSEDRIALFLYVSSLMWFIRRSVRHQPTTTRKVAASREKRNNRSGGGWHHHLLLHFTHVRRFATAGLVGVVARAVVPAAWLCRPEQTWCYDFALLNTDNNSSDVVSSGDVGKERRSAKTERFWAESMASAFCLLFIVVSIRQVIKREGNAKKPLTAATICPTLLLPVCASFIFFHWIIQSFPDKQVSELPNASIVFLPLCTYFLLLVSALWWVVAPLTVHIMFPDRFGNYQHAPPQLSEREVVVHYCQMLKQELSDCKQQTLDANLDIEENDLRGRKQLPPAVFGLYTLMSASVIGVGEVVLLLLSLLLDRVLVVATFVLTTPIVIDIVTTSHIDDQFLVSWAAVAVWHLSSVHWWFISGHQASLASIPWQAAFVGVQGNHATVVLPALMVTAHVFASQIIHTVCLPLLVLWPIARSRKDHRASRFNSEHEFLISDQFWPSVNQLFFKHITLHAFKLLGCIVSTFVHRRHLMVWQIFAPRFLYESLSFLVVCATSLATYLYLLRINWCTSRWITSVQSDRRFRVT